MVLLDLLGAPNPLFYSYFTESNNLFNQLVNAESRLGASGFLNDAPQSNAVPKKKNQGYFQPYSVRARIEDDHLPFLERGVCIFIFCYFNENTHNSCFFIEILVEFVGACYTFDSNAVSRSLAYEER